MKWTQNPVDLTKFVAEATVGFLSCAVWTDCGPDSEMTQGLNFSPEAILKGMNEITSFLSMILEQHPDILDAWKKAGFNAESLGHDFWLTRNRHGAGFWDRGIGNTGKTLSHWAKSCSSISVVECERNGKKWWDLE